MEENIPMPVHDTHLSDEEAKTRSYCLLHWSEETVRMYPREVTARNNKIRMGDIVAKCYVKPLKNIGDLTSGLTRVRIGST